MAKKRSGPNAMYELLAYYMFEMGLPLKEAAVKAGYKASTLKSEIYQILKKDGFLEAKEKALDGLMHAKLAMTMRAELYAQKKNVEDWEDLFKIVNSDDVDPEELKKAEARAWKGLRALDGVRKQDKQKFGLSQSDTQDPVLTININQIREAMAQPMMKKVTGTVENA